MILFFDTSALIKRYLNEVGTEKVESLFESATLIIVSSTAQLECASAFQRLLKTKFIDLVKYNRLKADIAIDFPFFHIVEYDSTVREECLKVIDKYPLRALDTIQLASALQVLKEIDYLVVSDKQLINYATKEGFTIIDPIQNL